MLELTRTPHIEANIQHGKKLAVEARITASLYRPDLNGYYGWEWSIPGYLKTGLPKKYYFYGINEPYGVNAQLSFGGGVSHTHSCKLCPETNLTYEQCVAAIMTILD